MRTKITSVKCQSGDLVRVYEVHGKVDPEPYRVVRTDKTLVYLSCDKRGIVEHPWHLSRVIEVIPPGETNEMDSSTTTTETLPVTETEKPRRGRKPKPRAPEVPFNFADYIASFGDVDGVKAEHWLKPTEFDLNLDTASHIVIEPGRKRFWYFGTYSGRPNKNFSGDYSERYGRHFILKSYEKKIKALIEKGYVQQDYA